jgi:hypothetical protein
MYAGVGVPIPIPTTAAHIPQQGLVPVPPKVAANARGTAYRPLAPALRLPGESPYAARIRNAPAVLKERLAAARAARVGMSGFAQDEANAFQAMVDAARSNEAEAAGARALFLAAGAPIDDARRVNQLVQAHHDEVAANVTAAAQANRSSRLVAMPTRGGGVVMVDPMTDKAAAAAAVAAGAGNRVAVKIGNPLAAAALAVSPADARAAAVFGQSAPNVQTALLAKAQAKAATPAWLSKLLWGK